MTDYREAFSSDKVAFQAMLDDRQASMWTALVGIVQSVDLVAMTCQVRPATMGTVLNPDLSRQQVEMSMLVDVPLVFPRGGMYTFTFPVQQGDECLVVIASRCIDNWWQSGGVQPPFELRMHDLSDGFALVGPYSQATKIANISTNTAQIRTNDGSIYFEIDGTKEITRMVTPNTSVVVDEKNLQVTATVKGTYMSLNDGAIVISANEITLDGNVTISGSFVAGPTTINGNEQVNGNIHATGSITP